MLPTIAPSSLIAGAGPGFPLATEAQGGAVASPFAVLLQATMVPGPTLTLASGAVAVPAATETATPTAFSAGEAARRSPAILPLGIEAVETPAPRDGVMGGAALASPAKITPHLPAGDQVMRVTAAPSPQVREQGSRAARLEGAALLPPVAGAACPQPIAGADDLPQPVAVRPEGRPAATGEEVDDQAEEPLALPAESLVSVQPVLLAPFAVPTQPVLPTAPALPALPNRSVEPLLPTASAAATAPELPVPPTFPTQPVQPAPPAPSTESVLPTPSVLPNTPAAPAVIALPAAAAAEIAPQPALVHPKPIASAPSNETAAAAAPRGKASKEDARANPAAPAVALAGVEEDASQAEAAPGDNAPVVPSVPPAQGAATEPATVASNPAESLALVEARPELPVPGQETLAPPPARAAFVADAGRGDLPAFAPQLQATAAFTQAEHVTARLFAHKAEEGGSRLTIELDPIELGSIEVSLQRDERGAASATFTVERPETLQLLQRDTRTLVDLLAGAGFSVEAGSLGFELRQEQQEARQQHQPAAHLASRGRTEGEGRPGTGPAPPPPSRGLLDLRV